jgi:hypothetical protein
MRDYPETDSKFKALGLTPITRLTVEIETNRERDDREAWARYIPNQGLLMPKILAQSALIT